MKYLISAFADEAADDFKEQIRICKKHSIENIEIRGVDGANIGKVTPAEAKEIKKTIDGEGIKIPSIGSPYGKIGILDDFSPHLEDFKRTIEVAHILGAKYLRMFSFFIPEDGDRKKHRSQVMEQIGAFLDHADGIMCCHENESHIYGEDAEHNLDIFNAFGGKLRLIFDPANYVCCKTDSLAAYKLLKPHIEYFHIKDCVASSGKIAPAGCGDGHIPYILKDFISDMKQDTYLTIEPHLAVFTGLSELTGSKLDFSFNSREEAFEAAVNALNSVLEDIA